MQARFENKRFLRTEVTFNRFVIALSLLLGMQGVNCASLNTPVTLRNSPTALAAALGAISPSTVHELSHWYNPEAIFIDPEVKKQGIKEIITYFKKLLEFIKVEDTIINNVINDKGALIVFWDSYVSLKGQPLSQFKSIKYEMVSELRLDSQDRIIYRKDYFDQFTLYQRIPGFKEKIEKMLNKHIGNMRTP